MIDFREQRRHYPFYLGFCGGIATLVLALWFEPAIAIESAANAFFLIYLALSAAKIPHLTPAFLKKHAAGADEPAWVILAVTFGAVIVAVGSLFLLINKDGSPNGVELGLSMASVTFGWLTIHTMAALHYAHVYWRPEDNESLKPAKKPAFRGGLDFPGNGEPEGYDFLYFALVTGMTAQTSDVCITSTGMRKLNMLHAVVSFFFNTVLVAATVNLAVSLGQ